MMEAKIKNKHSEKRKLRKEIRTIRTTLKRGKYSIKLIQY